MATMPARLGEYDDFGGFDAPANQYYGGFNPHQPGLLDRNPPARPGEQSDTPQFDPITGQPVTGGCLLYTSPSPRDS